MSIILRSVGTMSTYTRRRRTVRNSHPLSFRNEDAVPRRLQNSGASENRQGTAGGARVDVTRPIATNPANAPKCDIRPDSTGLAVAALQEDTITTCLAT